MKQLLLSLTLLLGCSAAAGTTAFVPAPLMPSAAFNEKYPSSILFSQLDDSNDEDVNDKSFPTMNRRSALQQLSFGVASSVTAIASTSALSQRANAASKSDLFKPNPLTNPALEQLRIWNQDEADNIKYGGELESGSAKPAAFDQYVQLLQPILSIDNDLATIDDLLKNEKLERLTKADYTALFTKVDTILSKPAFDKINFKKAFNAFADNIYYSDPDRANLYLGGGAIPKTTQSIAYLLRNDILTTVEDMRAEVQYLLREVGKKSAETTVLTDLELEEIYEMSRVAAIGMKKYLDLVPPKELEAARAKFVASAQ